VELAAMILLLANDCNAVVNSFMSESCRVLFLEIGQGRTQQKWFTRTSYLCCVRFTLR